MTDAVREEVRENRRDIGRINEVVFNGYGQRIRLIQKQVDDIEKKLNWFFSVFITLQLGIIYILLRGLI